MNERRQSLIYLLFDAIAAIIAWTLFYLFRKFYIEPIKYGQYVPLEWDPNYFLAIALLPIFWVLLFALSGSYKKVYRKSRARELVKTLIVVFVGSVFLFFTVLIDDHLPSYQYYPYTFTALFSLQFLTTAILRLSYLTYLKNLVKRKEVGFNTLIVGEGREAEKLYHEIANQKVPQGYHVIGYTKVNGSADHLEGKIPQLGNIDEVEDIVKDYRVEDVIVAFDKRDEKKLKELIENLETKNVNIKIVPNMYDFVSGKVQMDYIFGIPLIEIGSEILPAWQSNLKRVIDVGVSLLVLVIGAPFFAILGLIIKADSSGPVFYTQQRIGLFERPFKIVKFRTMKKNAEKNGPCLSSDEDPRITKVGHFLRKYRLDEFPQFYNVLKGDMSLVGPRPERPYYINQIMEVAPHYRHLWKTKPGITSWGQVKFGYAETVDEMVRRLKYDILYIENMSLLMDLKILFYTVLIVFKGDGK